MNTVLEKLHLRVSPEDSDDQFRSSWALEVSPGRSLVLTVCPRCWSMPHSFLSAIHLSSLCRYMAFIHVGCTPQSFLFSASSVNVTPVNTQLAN